MHFPEVEDNQGYRVHMSFEVDVGARSPKFRLYIFVHYIYVKILEVVVVVGLKCVNRDLSSHNQPHQELTLLTCKANANELHST